jgi:hypothetical protein
MDIYRMLKNSPLGVREVSRMTTAYEVSLIELGIDDRADARTEIIASEIIRRANIGERNVRALADFAISLISAKSAAGDAT